MEICIGGGIANAAASVMALGYDPRFDLRRAYWLIAGIAGGHFALNAPLAEWAAALTRPHALADSAALQEGRASELR